MQEDPQNIELLTRPALRVFGVPFSRTHLWRLERAGAFPKRIYLSARTPVWRKADVLAWIEARAAITP